MTWIWDNFAMLTKVTRPSLLLSAATITRSARVLAARLTRLSAW